MVDCVDQSTYGFCAAEFHTEQSASALFFGYFFDQLLCVTLNEVGTHLALSLETEKVHELSACSFLQSSQVQKIVLVASFQCRKKVLFDN